MIGENFPLTIELVPSSSWFNNVRTILTKTEWDILKRKVYSQAWDVCEICSDMGPKHPVECHEIWSYDDKLSIQKLEKMIALCPNCHATKHYGLAQLRGKEEKILKHFMKINKVSKKIAERYITNAFVIWEKRSTKTWKLDISALSEYGINVKEIEKRQKAKIKKGQKS